MSTINISDSARIIGRVRMGRASYLAQGSVIRSTHDSVKIGNRTWILENSVLIGSPRFPLEVGEKTVFGHKCLAIGTSIGSLCEIGNGTIFLEGSKIGDMCIFGEGTLVPKNMVIPSGCVVIGRPARIIRRLNDQDKAMIKRMRGGDISLSAYEEEIMEGVNTDMGKLYNYKDKYPQIADSVYIYDSAELTGDVIVGENSIIGSGVRIVGDSHGPVRIGKNVHILENSVLHLLPDNELIIKDNVTIGPGCIVHGCTIGENSVIESGAIISDYSSLGKNTLVKSGSLVKQRSVFSDNLILQGFPAKEVGSLDELQERPPWSFD